MQASSPFRPSRRRAVAIAVGLLLLAVSLQWAMWPLLASRTFPFFSFFLAAVGIVATWFGWRPALIVLVVGFINAMLWLQSRGFGMEDTDDGVSIALYVAAAVVLLAVGGKLHRLQLREQDLSTQVQDLQALQELGSRVALLPDLKGQLTAILRIAVRTAGCPEGIGIAVRHRFRHPQGRRNTGVQPGRRVGPQRPAGRARRLRCRLPRAARGRGGRHRAGRQFRGISRTGPPGRFSVHTQQAHVQQGG